MSNELFLLRMRFLVKPIIILALVLTNLNAHAVECSFLSHAELGKEVLAELNSSPMSCHKNNVHLSFDDGPSTTVTPEILKELKLRKVQASFFVTTTNLDTSNPKHLENRALVQKALSEGHLIANHGHEHHAHDLRMNGKGEILEEGFTQKEREAQLKRSVDLLNWSTQGKFSKQTPLLFRFPYGRGAMPSERELKHMIDKGEIHLEGKTYAEQLKEYRQISPALQTLASSGHAHLGWNHDSNDSSFGVKTPEKKILKDYIVKNIKGLCASPQITKVALFHDIKEMNISAIPVIVDIGKCLGLNFINAQDMAKDQQLEKAGVLISKDKIQIGTIENVIKGLESVNQGSQLKCDPKVIDKSCYSQQYQKSYPHCSGGDSVCFEGKWYSRTDPVIKNNCNLKD